MKPPSVLFFARGYQADFFPTLESERYLSVFVTLTKSERTRVQKLGGRTVGCFEEDYETLPVAEVNEGYLETSFMSDRFLGRYSYDKRREILGKEISFWAKILDECRPAAVVNELVAIEISEVLLIECRARNIRYLAGMNSLVDGQFYWLRNPLSLSGSFLPEVEPGAAALAGAARYCRDARQKDYKPFYVMNLDARRSLKPLAAAAVKLTAWRLRRAASAAFNTFRYELYDDEYAKRLVVFCKSFTHSYDTLADIPQDAEVVYFPLHQEPEATLNYMSEFYSNQGATIENILKCLGPGQVLVVKEHPVDKGSLLRKKFWDLRRKFSALYFLPAELHGRELLAVCSRVVTLTSTVGWEAAMLGKAVYVLGRIFYDHLEIVKRVANFDELRKELRSAAPQVDVDPGYVERFVASMAEQSHPGNPFPHADLYAAENRRRVAGAITAALDEKDR